MTLCFASFIKVLKICAKPKVYNKTLCEAVVKTLDVYTGNILGSDDSQISHLLSCGYNLSPNTIVMPMRKVTPHSLSPGMSEYVVPLLKNDMIPYAILALRDMALSTVKNDNEMIGSTSRHDLALMVPSNPADFFADVFYFTATEIDNKAGKDNINGVINEYVKSFCKEKAIKLSPLSIESDKRNNNTTVIESPSSKSSAKPKHLEKYDTSYYQLIVTYEDIHNTEFLEISMSRFLNDFEVPLEFKDYRNALTKQYRDKLKSFVAIICHENTELNGETDPNQLAILAEIDRIKPNGKSVGLHFKKIETFPQTILCEHPFEFDLTMDRPVTTLNTSQWTIREIDVFQAFKEIGYNEFDNINTINVFSGKDSLCRNY